MLDMANAAFAHRNSVGIRTAGTPNVGIRTPFLGAELAVSATASTLRATVLIATALAVSTTPLKINSRRDISTAGFLGATFASCSGSGRSTLGFVLARAISSGTLEIGFNVFTMVLFFKESRVARVAENLVVARMGNALAKDSTHRSSERMFIFKEKYRDF